MLVVFLILFNLPHLFFRGAGLVLGYGQLDPGEAEQGVRVLAQAARRAREVGGSRP